MQTAIEGTMMPLLRVMLEPGDRIVAETGELCWKTPSISMTTTTAGAGARGFLGAVRRSIAGGGLFLTEYAAGYQPGVVAFASRVPGTIHEHQVLPGQAYLVHRHGYLCSTPGVTLDLAFQKSLGAGIFGGDGFRLQRVSGNGTFWSALGGGSISHVLAPGEVIEVHPGHVGMFEESVNFDITMMPGIRNKLFGGDGFFFARLTGPGRVWLQTLTVPGLAHALEPFLSADVQAGAAEGVALTSIASRLIRRAIE